MGAERARDCQPASDLSEIRARLADTAQARQALALGGPPPWPAIPDPRPLLERVRMPGALAEGAELRTLLPGLGAAPRLAAYGRGLGGVAPDLTAELTALPALPALRDLLERSLDEDGAVRDEASPALRRLRQRERDLRQAIVRRLDALLAEPGAAALFTDRYVTVRHGRYVVPLQSGARGRLRGIVHDRSQSGATLFLEPEALVEANNDLVEAERREEAEVLRILGALTDAVREALPDLDRLVEGLGRLDLVFARAELAERMQAVEPAVEEARTVTLHGARHPLLLAQSWEAPDRPVVPVDLFLDAERTLLVITGPNAGGKTVALKTLGLLALMAQAGLHVPAREGARLPRLSGVFAIVGDEQSVAENLSTFSAFVRHLRQVLDRVDDHSLVLLDELGAGTDPDDGAALAQAVLEELAGRGALCVASTHLEPLKAFAATHPRARNAAVEFDGERLAPTYRLLYDRPGQSWALAIGARLGLPPHLIERAQAHRSAHARRLEELLERLDARDRQDAERAATIERREAESATLVARAQAELDRARAEAGSRLDRARSEAQRLLADIRRAVNQEWERLRREDRSRQALERSRRRLGDAARRLDSAAAGVSPEGGAASPPAPGDRVQVPHLGLQGEVLAVDGAQVTIRAGAVTVKVPAEAITAKGQAAEPAAGSRPAGSRPADGVSVRVRGGGVPGEVRLIGRTTDEARDVLEKYLDDAFLAGLPSVRIVHGKGTGALRRAVQGLLAAHPLVASHRAGAPHEGGEGATVAELRIA